MNILLVDDDMVDRKAITRVLKRSNLNVKITEMMTVQAALKQYAKENFDLVLLDYNLPVRNGLEMLIEIRNQREESNTTFIMMSSSEDEDIALKCIKAGAEDFLVKSDISEKRIKRAILLSTARQDLENKLFESYKKVKILAETDSLTGLPNRYFFDESLKLTLAKNSRNGQISALLLFDVDNFKLINDNFGHDVGDIFLQKTVVRIKSCLRGDELFARLGGDEFSIILPNIESSEHASSVAQRIINAMREPFEVASTVIHATVSIGIALHPDSGRTNQDLFKHADIAMYRAKKWGRNQACFFEKAMQEKFYKRLQTEIELREAIEKQQFQLYYQPVIAPESGAIKGFEALIRWNINGIVRVPDQFIKVAEETQQILAIGLWVIEEAISTLAEWNSYHNKRYTMSINVSAVQLRNNDIVEFLQHCLTKYSVSAYLVEIELTETVLLKDTTMSRKTISMIKAIGCRLSLDDFGTGFSSISHLLNYPISIVKIDKGLMPDSILSTKNIALIEGVVAMATILGLDVIAEGVESQEHVDLCIRLKIKSVQGFFYSCPIPGYEIKKMIENEFIIQS